MIEKASIWLFGLLLPLVGSMLWFVARCAHELHRCLANQPGEPPRDCSVLLAQQRDVAGLWPLFVITALVFGIVLLVRGRRIAGAVVVMASAIPALLAVSFM